MIVRPTAGALPAQQRARNESTPLRRRANSTGSVFAKEAAARERALAAVTRDTHDQPLSVSPPSASASARALTSPTFSKYSAESLLRSVSGKRKIFRLKRPSSSHADVRPAVEPGASLRIQVHGAVSIPQGTAAFISPPASPSVPPRPPRNPARVRPIARPSSSSGHPPKGSRLHTVVAADGQELNMPGDAAAEWEFPLPRGSEFPLQRKKSKSSRINSSRIMQDESAKSDLPFSTVDRTILEELRQKIRAREEQFVVRSGRKYHAFPAEEVPYPRCYDRQMVDMDVWDDLWQLQLGGSITMHVFDTPPARVLDLGCGTGTWILTAAREWKDTYFVGLDVVPLHPDLMQVGCFDLAARITWVQANFLERLPFPNEEFDYVRLVRVARGVPEDKWDSLLEEITRVMKPGGAFEMWEEDLHFPGSRRESVSIFESPDPVHPPTPPMTDSSHSFEQDRVMAPPSAFAFPPQRPPMAFSYSFDDISKVRRSMFEEMRRPPLHMMPSGGNVPQTPMLLRSLDKPPINPHDHSLLEAIYVEMHSARFINLEPVALLANMLTYHFKDVRAPPPIIITFPPAPPLVTSDERTEPSPMRHGECAIDSDSEDHTHPHIMGSPTEAGPGTFTFPDVLHGRDMAQGTPFVGLDANRYSGFSPAALRRSTIDDATHPPVPPIAPLPPPVTTTTNGTSSHGISPLMMSSGLNRHLLASKNPLPNKTVNFDPRSLNLLLTLRAQEVLGCAEPMWDWVVDFQESVSKSAGAGARSPRAQRGDAHLTFRTSRRKRHPRQDELTRLTRQEFDALMRRFELDMKARMYLGAAVEDRLGWSSYTASTTEEREEFEAMCVAWAEYEQRQAGATIRGRPLPKQSPPRAPPTPRRSDATEEDADATLRGPAHISHYIHQHAFSQTHIIPPPQELNDGDSTKRRKSAPGRGSKRPSTAGSTTNSSRSSALSSITTMSASQAADEEQELPPTSRTGRIFVAWKA